MKLISLFLILLLPHFSFSQDIEKIKTEGEITDITFHQGKKVRETATVKFTLLDGTEQMGSVSLFRIPFLGSMKSVGDKITITYHKDNPAIIETVFGNFLNTYGMYILILLGIIFSIKPFIKRKKKLEAKGS